MCMPLDARDSDQVMFASQMLFDQFKSHQAEEVFGVKIEEFLAAMRALGFAKLITHDTKTFFE